MTAIARSTIIFLCVFGGSLAGMWLRTVLPEHHLNTESKSVVTMAVGLIGTMAALLLGLLVASAKSSYDTRSTELTQMAANAILLDRVLVHYGSETKEVRGILRVAINRMLDQVWPKDGVQQHVFAKLPEREILYDKIEDLKPQNDGQRSLQSQAESIAISLGQTRWLLFEQGGSSIATPFLVVMVFWLTVLFLSFGLFAPCNGTTLITLLLSAMSVAAAIFLILELDQPFSGLIQISDAPLRNALAVIGK